MADQEMNYFLIQSSRNNDSLWQIRQVSSETVITWRHRFRAPDVRMRCCMGSFSVSCECCGYGRERETSCGQLMSHRTISSESLGFVNRPEQDYWRTDDSARSLSDVRPPAREHSTLERQRQISKHRHLLCKPKTGLPLTSLKFTL